MVGGHSSNLPTNVSSPFPLVSGQQPTQPTAPVPELYHPLALTPGRLDGILSGLQEFTEPGLCKGGDEDTNSEVNERERAAMLERLRAIEQGCMPPQRNVNAPLLGARVSILPSFPSGGASAEEVRSRKDTERLEGLLRRLQFIPIMSQTGEFREEEDEVVGSRDWEVGSWYKGKRQPPLAARLDTVVKFLAEEDVDQCLNWREKFDEIVSYLEWLALGDGNRQLQTAHLRTRAMFDDAVLKAKAHVLFEKHHYEPPPPSTMMTMNTVKHLPRHRPLRSTRLDWMVGRRHHRSLPCWTAELVASGSSELLPRAILPRPPAPVNRMLVDRPNDNILYDQFAEDERRWWHRTADSNNHPGDKARGYKAKKAAVERQNLAHIEDQSFLSVLGGQDQEPHNDTATTTTVIRDDSPATRWARERGVRRAGLHQVLCSLPTDPLPIRSHRNTLILPISAAVLRRARERADGLQWTPPSLPPSELPPFHPQHHHHPPPPTTVLDGPETAGGGGQQEQEQEQEQEQDHYHHPFETMPYTLSYRDRLQRIRQVRERAMLRVMNEEKGKEAAAAAATGRQVALPRNNLVVGGPLVRKSAARDLLRACRTALALLRAADRRVPRPLLTAVLRTVRKGTRKGGNWMRSSPEGDASVVPAGIRLAADEWELREWDDESGGGSELRVGCGRGRCRQQQQQQQQQQQRPRLLEVDEVEWLKFLAGECVNRKNWTGRFVPDTPKDKYRLFLLFATKVQKLLDDKNPQGLFASHRAAVEVEDLLRAINAGKDSSAVTKHEFQPHDACCWLDRLRKSGHVRFHLDPCCYGIVKRPEAEFFPEHRVLWPAEAAAGRPSFSRGDVADWGHVILDGHVPDTGEGSAIWNFFLALAFRLGYTISILEAEAANHHHHHHQPSPVREHLRLRRAIDRWKRTCTLDAAGDGGSGSEIVPTAGELAVVRRHLIDELHANETMLHPARRQRQQQQHQHEHEHEHEPLMVRDFNWDWAAVPRPGRRVPRGDRHHQFWSLDRWPAPSPKEHGSSNQDRFVDGAATYNPAAADPTTDRRYTQPRMRPYGFERVQFRPGPAVFQAGDTRLQREVLRGLIEEDMAEYHQDITDGGWDEQPQQSRAWGDILSSWNPMSRSSSRAPHSREAEGEDDKGEWESKLPPVDVSAIPSSWDPAAAAEQHYADHDMELFDDSDEAGDYDGHDDDIQSVDIFMTGMGEPWKTA